MFAEHVVLAQCVHEFVEGAQLDGQGGLVVVGAADPVAHGLLLLLRCRDRERGLLRFGFVGGGAAGDRQNRGGGEDKDGYGTTSVG